MSEKRKHTPGPAWGSAYYKGAAGAAAREALAVTEAARNLQTRAEQLDMAAQEIAVLEAINADLLAALEGLMEWEDEIAANLGLHTNPAPLMAKARTALAKARGEVGDE